MSTDLPLMARRLATHWNTTSTVSLTTDIAFVPANGGDAQQLRFAYVTAVADIELIAERSRALDLTNHSTLTADQATTQVADGSVAVWLTTDHGVGSGSPTSPHPKLARRRQVLRAELNSMRFLLRQFALDEVSSHRGASSELLGDIERQWTDHHAVVLDVAMQIALGADRQRYTDPLFAERIRVRARSAASRLAQVGVRSNPLLALG